MSKINELIQTLCSDGVEYKKLGDLIRLNHVNVVTPSFKIKRNDYLKEGTVAIISQEAEYISGYWNVNDNRIVDDKYVCFGDHSEHLKYIDFPFVQGADGLKIMKCVSNTLNTKYLYYSLCNEYIRQNDYARHFSKLRETSIPIPPRPVQDEIVRILDEYTDLEAELEAKLSEEIELKQKQYMFYMDKLLTFGDDVERKKLGEVCILSAGGDAPKTHMSKIKSDEYKYPIYSNGIGDNALYGYTDEYKISSPCVTVAARGTIGWAALRMEPFYPIVRLICVLPNDYDELNVSFLKYFIDIMEFPVPEGGIPQLTVPMLKNREIPIPSLTEQERIVKILDKYDTYTRDMISALNTELESRKKQYAYYRNQLLTFKRKE